MQEYSIRIVVLDYYMSSPLQGLDVLYSEFRSSSITKVPVLRCFGSTPSGEKMCLHIHGVFPYIYIPYDGSGDANSLMYQIALDLDKAINISMNQAASNVQHVYKVQLVSGMPMYGFHPKRHQFFKIYLYNPLLINKVSTLLQNEQILGKKYQPHEAHINFTLQFMIDYNLHGMSNLKVYNVNFRGNPEDITNKDLHLPLDINKITVCQLEGDVIAENIINRQEIVNGGLSVNPGISSLWEDERQRRRLKNRDSQLTHFLQIHRVNVSPTNSHMIYKKALLDRLAILADDRKIDEIDISVYPAEIPEGADIQNASIIDLHTPSSLEISLDQTVSLDDFKLSVDANAQDLVDILENLGQNVNENLEEDSILSQIVNDEDDSIEELDMTMPLETMTTPHKIIAIKENISDEWSDDNSCDITLIPQLDGSVDDLGIQMVHFFDNIQNSTVEGANSEKINDKSIFTPFLNVSCSLNESDDRLLFVKLEKLDRNKDNMSLTGNKMNSHTRASQHMHRNRIQPLKVLVTSSKVKKQLQQKRKDEVKLFFHKIQKLNKTNKLQKIMKIISQKENCVNKLLKTSKPIFNIISPDKYKDFMFKSNDTSSLVSEILKQTHNFVDPSLYVKISYPDNQCFLYYYKGNTFPNVIQLPDEKIGNEKTHHRYFLRPRDREKLRKLYQNACESDSDSDADPDFKCSLRNQQCSVLLPVNNTNIQKYHKFVQNTFDNYDDNNNLEEMNKLCLISQTMSNPDKAQENSLIQTYEYVNKKLHEYLLTNIGASKNLSPTTKSDTDNLIVLSEGNQTNVDSKNNNFNNTNISIFFSKSATKIESENNRENKKANTWSENVRQKVVSKINCLNSNIEKSPVIFEPINYPSISNQSKQVESRKYEKSFFSLRPTNLDTKNVLVTNRSKICKELNTTPASVFSCVKEDKSTINAINKRGKIVVSSIYLIKKSDVLTNNCCAESSVGESKHTIYINEKLNSNLKKERIKGSNKKFCFSRFSGKETFLKYLLDGANDSSSEDEIPSKKRKVYRRKNVFTRYAQHHVSAASSSKGNNHENLLGSKEDILVSSSHSMGYKKADAVVQINNSNSVKRRLTFYPALTQPNGSSCGDATCKYSSFPSSLVMTRHITSDSENSDIKENNTNSENSSESDIFSASENEHSNSFFEKHCAHLPKPRVETFIKVTPKYTTSVPLQLYKICTDNVPISKEKLNDTNRTSQSFIKAQLKLYTPVNKPPSYVEVKSSLDILKIPHVKQQEPFYNNVEDVTGSVDIGYNVLKIKSKTTANVSEFDSSYNGLHPYRKRVVEGNSSSKWNKNNIKNLTLSFCQDKTVIIKPIQLAPSVKKVTSWINKYSKDLSLVENMVKKYKISIPLSNSDHIEDNNLTTFSCTPIFSGSDSSENTEESSVSANISKKTSLRKSVLNEHEIIYNRSCEISGVSQNNTFGFDQSVQNFQNAKTIIIQQNLTILVIELHIRTRGDFKPNPELDAICALFYSILNDVAESHPKEKKGKGVLVVNDIPLSLETKCPPLLNGINCDCEIMYVDSEENLINEFLKLLQYWDPDILAGYETQMLSWGYLVERAYILNINLVQLLGRSKISMKGFKEQPESENITGRVILDVWRLMRPEIALQSYSFESIVYHILHKRVPMYAFKDLSFWWDHKTNLYRHHTVHYYIFRVEAVLELLDKLDLIGRTSELARLFGIQFFEVLSRGSQFRVESMMLRLAKPLNFIPVSPSVTQRAQMKAPEYIPLVMEPESKLYNDPLIVLDFQSMYPSIIIAYNYCFTTCLGRVECLGKNGQFKFGATNLKISRKVVERLVKRDLLNFSPCGVAFVKCEVRDGILPRMLREILDTRLMVKNSMKENKDNKVLQKVLHNRQLGLKLIANVTYGYTAANFSGRMCCVEVGDSVVSKGRETLQRAIALVDNTLEWGAKVVYGDTDSLFVLVPGRSKEAAFEVGEKIATAVTNDNPDPIKLKLEKIYQPSILQTKKRYVGYMYESPDQKEPIFDAKGIETVRRDGCPAVAKILEKCLRLLFETKDVSLIKRYVLKQFTKIIAGRASIQDLTFAKEYRGSSGYKAGSCVPALELSRKWTAIDKRNEPRCGERVPYIIVSGPPGLPLIRLVKSPRDLLDDPSLKPNAMYYISKVIIPPLNRCFSLIGADINTWFSQMPRKINHILPTSSPSKKNTISQYFATSSCASCEDLTQTGLCDICSEKPQETYITLMEKLRMWEQNSNKTVMFCKSCTSFVGVIKCISLDCPILYRRIQTSHDVQQTTYIRQLLNSAESLF